MKEGDGGCDLADVEVIHKAAVEVESNLVYGAAARGCTRDQEMENRKAASPSDWISA